jgi:hypothetical protein
MQKINIKHHEIKFSCRGKPGKTQIKPKINIKHYKVLISGGDNQDKKGKPK